jgi:hypothetical protein
MDLVCSDVIDLNIGIISKIDVPMIFEIIGKKLYTLYAYV